jgi:hypothetical protein
MKPTIVSLSFLTAQNLYCQSLLRAKGTHLVRFGHTNLSPIFRFLARDKTKARFEFALTTTKAIPQS